MLRFSLLLVLAGTAFAQNTNDTKFTAAEAAKREGTLLKRTRQLTFEGKRSGEGYFDATGSRIVFQSERQADNPFYQIYLMDLETGDTDRVSPGQGKTTCAWIHPTDDRVLFASTHADKTSVAQQQYELRMQKSGYRSTYRTKPSDAPDTTRVIVTELPPKVERDAVLEEVRKFVFETGLEGVTGFGLTSPEDVGPGEQRFLSLEFTGDEAAAKAAMESSLPEPGCNRSLDTAGTMTSSTRSTTSLRRQASTPTSQTRWATTLKGHGLRTASWSRSRRTEMRTRKN